MTPHARRALFAVLVVAALFAGWRVYGQRQAERLAATDPVQALQWRPGSASALLVLAERQLAQGQPRQAQATARRLLRQAPLKGQAFRVLAAASDQLGDRERAFRLYLIAARRAPRDVPSRVWLAQRYLEAGKFDDALHHIDSLLRMAPQRAAGINPVLVRMAQVPAFADALSRTLLRNPPWRDGLLVALQKPGAGNADAAGRVMQYLQDHGGLSSEDYGRWLNSLMTQGRWGEAYARWAGSVVKPGGRLPLLYNGDFAQEPSSTGFDWRIRRVPGVLLDFLPEAGTGGQAAYLQFLDRRIPGAGLEQPLLLSPGGYRLRMRMRARALRSELGLQWQVACVGPAGIVARSEPVQGDFPWRAVQMDFTIPQEGCPGQWLRLVNPVPAGAAQGVAGELWLADMELSPST